MRAYPFPSRNVYAALVGILTCLAPGVEAADLVSAQRAVDTVVVHAVSEQNGLLFGQIANRSDHVVRDVRLLIRFTWSWNDERNPGSDSPGRAVYHTVSGDIAPGQSAVFHYRPAPPLPERPDGHFTPSAEVVGFTEVGD